MQTREFKNFLLDVREDGIAILTVHRPEVKNAVNNETFDVLKEYVEYADAEDSIKLTIITGEKDSFIAGADIREFSSNTPTSFLFYNSTEAVRAVEKSKKPFIAAVNGYAFGGGFELALACDIRVMSENAKLTLPETGLGVIPGCGGTMRLARMVGIGRAKEIIMAKKIVKGEEAVAMGLAISCVPQEQLMEEALAVAGRILSNGPKATSIVKRLIQTSYDTNIETGLLLESLGFCVMCDSEEMHEGVDAFLGKRKANFYK